MQLKEESLCNKCPSPGRCCRRFALANKDGQIIYPASMSRSTVRRMVKMEGLPFTPMEKGNVEWFFSCSKLTESGRCGIYEDRPEVCRKYIASTEICHPGASDVIIVSDRLLDPVQQENILT